MSGFDVAAGSRSEPKQAPPTVKVWDPLVRVLHWSLATAFALAFATGESIESLHLLAGYAVLVIVGLRALWGLVGTPHARFDDFVPNLGKLLAYVRDLAAGRAERYVGHNPAGGAMVVLLLAILLGTAASGVLTLYGGDAFEELHEGFANANLALVLVHIAGVLVSSRLHRENLVRAMITGHKRA
ncbi:MAG: cytochrome B [Rhodospirillaceae bacterium]|jgi:cytochrome b|nr:cytochrome B [Rhodospirillaceae bacterium]